MITRIDWISFTVFFHPEQDGNELDALRHAATAIEELSDEIPGLLHLHGELEPGQGRAPYRNSWRNRSGGVTLFTGPNLPHALVEVSGRSCERMHLAGTITPFLALVADRLSRLDIACDMLCETSPLDFVAQRADGRFKSHSEFVSASGTTAYVGSRTSDRYARVYRYNEPHERAHLLRSEFVVKKENARATAAAILADGIDAVAVSMGANFGWEHPSWTPAPAEPAELKMYRPDRREGKTLYWLADTVAPLLVRLQQEGVLDAQAWLDENVISRLS